MTDARPRIALLPGDGIGPEVVREVRQLIRGLVDCRQLDAELVDLDWGADRYLATGEIVPAGGFELLSGCAAILVGAFGDPRVADHRHAREILLGMRATLDLYVNLRPVRSPGERLNPLKRVPASAIDFAVVRENTEGLYSGAGGILHRATPEAVAIQEMVVTRRGVERVVRAAFELARTRRRKVTLVDKGNALEHAGELWRDGFAAVGAQFPDVEADHLYADTAALWLVLDPGRFDVIVTGNLIGDILSEVGAALQGGLGLAASANLCPGGAAMFEPVHGSAPDLAGRGVANPLAAFASCGLMLAHLGRADLARAVEAAVAAVAVGDVVTPDLGGAASTAEVGDEVRRRVLAGGRR